MGQVSLYKKYEEANRRYYGADRNPLRFVPVATRPEVAEELAYSLVSWLGTVSDEELTASALRAQQRNKFTRVTPEKTLDELHEEALADRLGRITTSIELTHARLAPGDFNEDSEKSGAYEMANGIIILPKLPPQ